MIRGLLAVAGAVAVAGCSLIPTYTRPALPVSDAYPLDSGGAGRAAADIGWRGFFTDPALQDLIALALADNRDLRVAAFNVQSAEASYRVDRAALFPTIDGTGAADFEHEPKAYSGGGFPLSLNLYTLGVSTVSYEIDLFGQLRSQARQARETFLSDAQTRQSTQITLVAEVASQYLAWLADREAIAVAAQTAAIEQHSYDLRVMTLNQGSGTALDVAEAESTLRTAQASLQQYRRQEFQDMDALVLLLGTPIPGPLQARMDARRSLTEAAVFPDLPAGLPSDLLTRRPDVRAAEHTLLAANANIGAARAAFFPELTLTGNGGTASGTVGSLFAAGSGAWMVEPQLSVPIFDAGRNFANLDIARVEKRSDIASYEKAIQSAFRDVADALAARETYTGQLDAERKLVDADEKYYTLSKMRFDAGVDSYLTVLVAQNDLFSAQINLITLRLAERQNLVTLYKALGGGWKA